MYYNILKASIYDNDLRQKKHANSIIILTALSRSGDIPLKTEVFLEGFRKNEVFMFFGTNQQFGAYIPHSMKSFCHTNDNCKWQQLHLSI